MKNFQAIALWCALLLPVFSGAQTYTWNGTLSSDWSTHANRTTSGIPDAAAPNVSQLRGDVAIINLSVGSSSLNYDAFSFPVGSVYYVPITNAIASVTSALAIGNFSPFTFGSSTGGGALPSFTAVLVPKGVLLNWTTAIAINHNHYIVERSLDGMEFESIGIVEGLGNTGIEQHYSFLDTETKAGMIYYRLQQVDVDGASELSEIDTVYINATLEADVSWSMYPNPVKNQLQIIGGATGRLVGIELMDQHGRSISMRPMVFGDRNTLDVSHLRPGIYTVRVITANKITSKRFIKL